MSLADDLNAPPLARRVAAIIAKHAAEIEASTEEWTLMAALRVLVEVERDRAASDVEAPCDGICVMGNEVIPGGGNYDIAAYPHPACPRHGVAATA